MKIKHTIACLAALLCIIPAGAQRYKAIDKSVAVIGNELITLSDIESEIQMMRAQGQGSSDRATRCQLLENMMQSKLFLMQARLDSLTVNQDMVEASLNEQMARVRTALGGDDQTEAYFGKSLYQLRKDWKQQFEDNSLIQQEQSSIAQSIPEITPWDVKQYLDTADVDIGFLDGKIAGKTIAYPRFSGFCLETQKFPDAIHHPEFPSIRLEPGETYSHRCVYHFRVR